MDPYRMPILYPYYNYSSTIDWIDEYMDKAFRGRKVSQAQYDSAALFWHLCGLVNALLWAWKKLHLLNILQASPLIEESWVQMMCHH